MELDYEVIASGSKGNAVRIENVMFDCGIPFKRMKEALYKCDTLLITHRHTDHITETTFNQIRKEFPRIKIYANYDVAYRYPVDKVIANKPFVLRKSNITVTPFDGKHDVPVTGYHLKFPDGTNVIYMTDSCVIKPPIDEPVDYCFLESNHSEDKLRVLAKQYRRKGYDPVANAKRHLSTEQCEIFFYSHRRSKDSVLIELHKSDRFY